MIVQFSLSPVRMEYQIPVEATSNVAILSDIYNFKFCKNTVQDGL